MKSLFKIILLTVVLGSVTSCQNTSKPNYQFMPDMYEDVGYDTYSESDAFANGIEAQLPADGTIKRGYIPFDIDGSFEGYTLAKETLTNPLNEEDVDFAKTKIIYDIYCGICHGTKGDGQGNLVKREKILGVPQFNDIGRSINEGSIYHVIYYGKNAMGSYANQLDEKERWEVVSYVMHLKAELDK